MDYDSLVAIKQAKERIATFHAHLRKNDWYPHELQKEIAREIFNNNKKKVWVQAGRSIGKSHLARYVALRYAIEHPNSAVYIVTPERKQAYEIHWIAPSCNILNMVPTDFLLEGDQGYNKSELRLNFKNGSFVKLDGSDNESSLRGYKPHFFVADEFQAWRQESWIAMEPNFIAYDATTVQIGTPPDRECYYTEQLKFFQSEHNKQNPRYYYLQAPTERNPRLAKDQLEELKRGFLLRGEEAVWRREYMAEFVPGGVNAVFGTLWDRRKLVHPHATLMNMLYKDKHKVRWYSVFDPGTTSVFATLHAVHNPYTADLFILDEIYERDRNKTSSTQIWERSVKNETELYPEAAPRTFKRWCDEAAAWFIREIHYNYRENINKTQKSLHSKESMISTIKDIMIYGKVHVSDRCRNLIWEIENYVTDEYGRLPDKDDHLVDCLIYLVSACNFRFVENVLAKTNELPQKYTIEQEFQKTPTEDWTEALNERYFDYIH